MHTEPQSKNQRNGSSEIFLKLTKKIQTCPRGLNVIGFTDIASPLKQYVYQHFSANTLLGKALFSTKKFQANVFYGEFVCVLLHNTIQTANKSCSIETK